MATSNDALKAWMPFSSWPYSLARPNEDFSWKWVLAGGSIWQRLLRDVEGKTSGRRLDIRWRLWKLGYYWTNLEKATFAATKKEWPKRKDCKEAKGQRKNEGDWVQPVETASPPLLLKPCWPNPKKQLNWNIHNPPTNNRVRSFGFVTTNDLFRLKEFVQVDYKMQADHLLKFKTSRVGAEIPLSIEFLVQTSSRPRHRLQRNCWQYINPKKIQRREHPKNKET